MWTLRRDSARVESRPGLRLFEILEQRIAFSVSPPAVVDVSLSSDEWAVGFIDHLAANGLGIDGYSVPVGSSAQEAPLPWDNLNKIRITFSEDVFVEVADLSLSGVAQQDYAFSDFSYSPETHEATWTLAAPLGNDSYQIDLDSDGMDPIRSLSGQLLDGDWNNSTSTYQSGDGTAGGDFEFRFRVLPGDALGIDVLDYNNFYEAYNRVGLGVGDAGYLARADIDGNGLHEDSDWQVAWDNLYDSTPTGDPTGVASDAPTASDPHYASISDDSIDVAFSLWGAFEDAEDSDSQLSYSIQSNSAASLFDSVSIDSQSGELVVNTAAAAGRAEIVVKATDTSGLSVTKLFVIDVNRQNAAPSITVTTTDGGQGLWLIEGTVTDSDDDVDDMYVVLLGLFTARVSVAEDGYFYFTALLDPGEGGSMWAYANDGAAGDYVYFEIGW